MTQKLPGRHFGKGFAVFLGIWLGIGIMTIPCIAIYLMFESGLQDDPIVALGGIAMGVLAVFIYSLPSYLACVTEHPSRSGVYFVNWCLGWTGIGWIVAMVWAFINLNARVERISREREAAPIAVIPDPKPGGRSRYLWGFVALVSVVACVGMIIHAASDPAATAIQLGQLTNHAESTDHLDVHKSTGEDDLAAEAKNPNMVSVTARSLSSAPGAILCSDYSKVSMLFDMYNSAWEGAMQDAVTHGQSKLLRGNAPGNPDPEDYGCHLIAPGTSMLMRKDSMIPRVTVELPDGSVFHGVTLPAMVSHPPQNQHVKEQTDAWMRHDANDALKQQNSQQTPVSTVLPNDELPLRPNAGSPPQ